MDSSYPSKVDSRLPPHNHTKTKESMDSAPQGFRSNLEPRGDKELKKRYDAWIF